MLDISAAFRYTDSEERGGAMRKMIPFAPWQTAYFIRWLGEMSRQGWALKDIKWGRAIFVPAVSGGRQYALFPSGAANEEIDELFLRIGDGSLTVPPELERPIPSDLMLPEDPRLAELVGKIGPYQYTQLINQLRREKGWEAVCDWDAFTVMRQTRPDAAQPPELADQRGQHDPQCYLLPYRRAVSADQCQHRRHQQGRKVYSCIRS